MIEQAFRTPGKDLAEFGLAGKPDGRPNIRAGARLI
jgi:hypothetical protein